MSAMTGPRLLSGALRDVVCPPDDPPADTPAPPAPPLPVMTMREHFLHASRPGLPLPVAFMVTLAALRAIFEAGWHARGKVRTIEEGWAHCRQEVGLVGDDNGQ